MDIDVTSNVLSYFRSLVRYEPRQPITIYHTSFYDYLISCEGRPWYVEPKVQRAHIASKCLEWMGKVLKYNICDIQSSYVLNKDVPNIDDRVTRYIPPFLMYICCNWARHLQDAPYSQKVYSQLQSFAHNQVLFWFEVLSLANTFNDHVGPALLFAIDWVGVSALCWFNCFVTNHSFRKMIRNYHLSLEMLISGQVRIRSQSQRVSFRSTLPYYL